MKHVFTLIILTLSVLAFSLTSVVIEFTADTTALYFEEYFDLFNQVKNYESAEVYKVVDGDTIWVTIERWLTKVRMIGLDTPETVHPTKPVEYFGKEASNFAKKILTGREVKLSYDWNKFDKYNRLLAYVWVPVQYNNSTKYVLFNLLAIINGYGHAYLYFPFKDEYMKIFKEAQDYARENSIGLWAGENASENEKESQVSQPQTQEKGDVRISYIKYSGNPEYIEIKNYGTSPVNLQGWKITDEGAKHVYVFGNVELKPGYVIRLYSGNKATENIWVRTYIWNNDGDVAYLYDSNGNLVDKYSY
ncbi:lamin tail domain-containing protein [Kosmotoga pacifica]|uniref:lamin tail domain-containing protein n=1 Tax=Kosmotoga pacifica TaxID=1330330 RepID=UPI00069ABDDB|nr:lamin tail domain-containing protein [Kosmotoga pacifica]